MYSNDTIEYLTLIRNKIIARDGDSCLCCGSKEKLELDHVKPLSRGGSNDEDNFQILCSHCNKKKGINTIRFKNLFIPNLKEAGFEYIIDHYKGFNNHNKEDIRISLKRIFNFFYHCGAVKNMDIQEKKINLVLHHGNKIEFIMNQETEIIDYLKKHNIISIEKIDVFINEA